MSRTKINEDANGNASSARSIGIFTIINAVAMLWACILFGFFHSDLFTAAVGVGIGLFGTVAGGTYAYLYGNKRAELKQQTDLQLPVDKPLETN